MNKEQIIDIIQNRIKSEYRKYKKSNCIDWAEMSAHKIYASLFNQEKTELEKLTNKELLRKMTKNKYKAVINRSRRMQISSLRHCAIHYLYNNRQINKSDLARLFNKRCHTTIINSLNRVNQMKGLDQYIDNAYAEILNNLKN